MKAGGKGSRLANDPGGEQIAAPSVRQTDGSFIRSRRECLPVFGRSRFNTAPSDALRYRARPATMRCKPSPDGLAQIFLISRTFIAGHRSALAPGATSCTGGWRVQGDDEVRQRLKIAACLAAAGRWLMPVRKMVNLLIKLSTVAASP